MGFLNRPAPAGFDPLAKMAGFDELTDFIACAPDIAGCKGAIDTVGTSGVVRPCSAEESGSIAVRV